MSVDEEVQEIQDLSEIGAVEHLPESVLVLTTNPAAAKIAEYALGSMNSSQKYGVDVKVIDSEVEAWGYLNTGGNGKGYPSAVIADESFSSIVRKLERDYENVFAVSMRAKDMPEYLRPRMQDGKVVDSPFVNDYRKDEPVQAWRGYSASEVLHRLVANGS